AFCCALTAAIKSGKETAAGVTATVRTGRGSVGRAIASGLFHDHQDVGRSQTARSSYTSATLADFSPARDSQITFSVTHGWLAFWRGRPWFAERRIGETSLAVGSSRFWIGWVTRHGDKCARSTCRD